MESYFNMRYYRKLNGTINTEPTSFMDSVELPTHIYPYYMYNFLHLCVP